MKTHISRNSDRALQRYSGVYHQQGRMLTDADWNELMDIVKRRINEVIHDAVGSGAPRERGLELLDNYRLQPGYLYVDGIIAQLPGESAIDYAEQPDFSEAPSPGGGVTGYKLYADVWERTVIALEDGELLDPGLHGADTCTRTRTMLQIKWCDAALDPMAESLNPTIGDAELTLALWRASTTDDPCDPCATEVALDNRVGNYLFRVEVHDWLVAGDGSATLTLKWSSENGAEQHLADRLPVGFDQGDWLYEFFNSACEENLGEHMAAGFSPSRGSLMEDFPEVLPDDLPMVRRWDGHGVLTRSVAGDWSFSEGVDKGTDLSESLDSEAHGYVAINGQLELNLNSMALALELGSSVFVVGDYWQAMVREAVHEPAEVLINGETPHGVHHHYLTLGEYAPDGTLLAPSDAQRRRFDFPPLTAMWAEDIGFEDPCPLVYEGAENVQAAFAALCDKVSQLDDMRKHNKHLHGWGVVCGLKVECLDDDRTQVVLSPGYALDCEGYDLDWTKEDGPVPVVDILSEYGVDVEGEYCLSMSRDENGEIQFHLTTTEKQSTWDLLFNGTLLGRIKQRCYDPLMELVDQLEEQPLHVLWAMMDMMWPTFGNSERPFVTPSQHALLEQVYDLIRAYLHSPTNCALTVPEDLPPYPFDESPRITGAVNEQEFELIHARGDGRRLYGFNDFSASVIQVLATDEMKYLDPITVTDSGNGLIGMAFGADLQRCVMAGREGVGADMRWVLYVSDDIDNSPFEKWLETDKPITDIAFAKGSSHQLFVLVHDEGLYQVALDDGQFPQEPMESFAARAGLELSGNGQFAYAAEMGDTGETNIVSLRLFETGGSRIWLRIQLGNFYLDDFKVWHDNEKIYVVGAQQANVNYKQLYIYSRQNKYVQPVIYSLGLGKAGIAMTPNQDRLYASRGWIGVVSSLWWLDPNNDEWQPSRYLPLQVGPFALEADTDALYAANSMSHSVLRIPHDLIENMPEANDTLDYRTELEDYRNGVVAAYLGFGQQFIKAALDCLCHSLLVDCPSCFSPPHQVPLACITFKEGEVDRICNLGHRKFVMSFPTLGYWLSIVPVLPWLKQKLAQFCCGNWFADLVNVGGFMIMPENAEVVGTTGKRFNVAGLMTNKRVINSFKAAPTMMAEFSNAKLSTLVENIAKAQQDDPLGAKLDVSGKHIDDAKLILEQGDVKVEKVVKIEEGLPKGVKLLDVMSAPMALKRGDKVTLYSKNDKVLFYAAEAEETVATVDLGSAEGKLDELLRRKEALADLSAINAEIAKSEARRAEVMNLTESKSELEKLTQDKAREQEELNNLKVELAGLKEERSQLADVATINTQLETLKRAREAELTAVEELEARRKMLTESMSAMRGDVEEISAMHAEITKAVAKDRPVRDVSGVDAATDKKLLELGIRTVEELAIAKPATLAAAEINTATARTLITAAKARIKS